MKNIIILEQNSPKEFLFKKAKEKGYSIIVVTNKMNDVYLNYINRDRIIITDIYDIQTSTDDVLAYVQKNLLRIDGVGTFSEDLVILCADLAELFKCKGIGSSAARRTSCNKLATRMTLSSNLNIKQPKFSAYNIHTDTPDRLFEFPKPCVIKPVFGVASHGVKLIIDNNFSQEELIKEVSTTINEHHRAAFRRFKGNMLIEEYIKGTMISVDGFVINGEVDIVGSLEFIMGQEPFFTQTASYVPARLNENSREDVYKVLKEIIKTLSFADTPFHAEFRISESGPVLIEIGGRMAGSLIHEAYDRVYGIDMIDMMFNCWLGTYKVVSYTPRGINYHALVYSSTHQPKRIKEISIQNKFLPKTILSFKKLVDVGDIIQTYPDIPTPLCELACFVNNIDEIGEIKKDIDKIIKVIYE